MVTPRVNPVPVDALSIVDHQVYWIEGRAEGDVLVRWRDGVSEVLPPGTHVASTVHEYGGGAYLVRRGQVWFVRAEDQRIWRSHRGTLTPVTPLPEHGQDRHADLQISADGLLVCVRERHRAGQVVNELMAVPADGSTGPRVIAQGWDFYSAPRIDPSGARLAWLTWAAPLMPWDGSWLWTAEMDPDGVLGPATLIAGGEDESVSQPRWSPERVLHFLTDHHGWSNLHRHRHGHSERVIGIDAELGPAPWEFGYASYALLAGNHIATTVQQGPHTWLGISHGERIPPEQLPLPYTSVKPYLATDGDRLAIIGSSPTQAPTVVLIDRATGRTQQLSQPGPPPPASTIAPPEVIRFPTRDGHQAHAVLHPVDPSIRPDRPKPPLLVRAHPGPTANTHLRLDPWVEFFTGHGFAVLDVDYRGSTGYGRAYRNALRRNWGVLDVHDCVDAVRHLADTARIDAASVAICGSSAGGYTALRAVATTDAFVAAAVRHAVIDPADWRRSAPKFQAHQAELLIAPPSEAEVYHQRSVLRHARTITAPVLIIHGAKDTITTMSQARRLATLIGLRATLIEFPDEGHGLRNPDHIAQAVTAELDHLTRHLNLS